MKEKEIIRLRHKKLQNGQTSLYLDFYFKGVRQYDFLRLYLVPEQTKADKLKNEETLRLANAIKAQRTVEFFNDLARLYNPQSRCQFDSICRMCGGK